MNKKFVIGTMLGMILIVSGLMVTAAQAQNPSYLIYGIVLSNSGDPTDGATITITNAAYPTEEITTTSFTDALGHIGSFQANLGNLASSWARGDNITISAASGSWSGSRTFTIPATGTMFRLDDISMNKTTGGGGGKEHGAGTFGGSMGSFGSILVVVLLIIVFGVIWFIVAAGKTKGDGGKKNKKNKAKL